MTLAFTFDATSDTAYSSGLRGLTHWELETLIQRVKGLSDTYHVLKRVALAEYNRRPVSRKTASRPRQNY